MTQILAQAAALLLLIAAASAWLGWVRATHRTVTAPERLNEIIVFPQTGAATGDEARAIAVGVAGVLAEHAREVALIQTAARLDEGEIRAPEIGAGAPSPALLSVTSAPADVDLAVELFGTKVDAKGLRAWFAPPRPPGSLDISVVFDRVAADGARGGVASTNFPEDKDYSFSLPVSGAPSTVARQIAMRILQARYGKSEPFFVGLSGEDFAAFWLARREAAEIALRSSGGGISTAELQGDSRATLARIEPIARRYPQWRDLQQLASYLASKSGDAAGALAYLQTAAARPAPAGAPPIAPAQPDLAAAPGAGKIASAAPVRIDNELARLRAAAALQAGQRTAAPVPPAAGRPLAAQVRDALGFSKVAPAGRAVRVIVIAGRADSFDEFGDRLSNGRMFNPAADTGDSMREYTNSVAGLTAALAPAARIEVVGVLSPNGGASSAHIVAALRYAIESGAEIIVVSLGPFDEATARIFERHSGAALIVLAAGNTGTAEPQAMARVPGAIAVGAHDGQTLAQFTNRGADVALYAPGEDILSYAAPDRLAVRSGTSYSAAIAAAVAANLAAAQAGPPGAAALRSALIAQAREVDGVPLLWAR